MLFRSDGDKAAVLVRLAPRAGESAAMRDAFFDAARSIMSDGSKREVLLEALKHNASDSTVAAAVAIARGMVSETERGTVLRAVAATQALASPTVREAFFRATTSMVSETARERVLTAALQARPADLAVAVAAADAASKMVSSTPKSNVLLEAAARTPILRDEAGRAAFFAAVKTIQSSSDYRRVMEAVVK